MNESCKEILQNLLLISSKIDGLCSDYVSVDILVVNSMFIELYGNEKQTLVP